MADGFIKFNLNFKQLTELKKTIKSGLEGAVKESMVKFVFELSKQNNSYTGNSDIWFDWYKFREKYYQGKIKPEEGFSAGNWRVTLSQAGTAFVQNYSSNSDPESVSQAVYNSMRSYKLGKTIYVVNNAPYVYGVSQGALAGHAGVGKYTNAVDIIEAYTESQKILSSIIGSL